MAYMGFTERPVVPQLVLIDRAGNIHYATPRNGDVGVHEGRNDSKSDRGVVGAGTVRAND